MSKRPKRAALLTLAGLSAGLGLMFLGLRGVAPDEITGPEGKLGSISNSETQHYDKASADSPDETVETGPDGKPRTVTVDGFTYPVRTYRPLMANDPSASQWWTRQSGLEETWDVAQPAGGKTVTVAVLDSGFALDHEEFSGRWLTNTAEQGVTTLEAPGTTNCTARSLPLDKSCNLIDDDSNGYVDDARGWDFADNDNDPRAGTVAPDGDSAAHGTMVAGVLAATGNNAKGMAGVDWHAKLLPLQVMQDQEYGNSLTVGKAIRYAADRGVKVINLSLGADEEDPYIRLAVRYALDAGAVVVAASGNDGCDCITYPANYPEVVAVGAHGQDGKPAGFSSFGAELDLIAPGTAIRTTSWSDSNKTGAYATGVSGTSFATPFISGLLSRAHGLQPEASWAELIAALGAQAGRDGLAAFTLRSNTLGAGVARADRFVTRVTTAATPAERLFFHPLGTGHALSTSRVYQCDPDEPVGLPVYGFKRSGLVRYTASVLEKERLKEDGWTVASEWPACAGLPVDRPEVARNMNLMGEVHNDPSAKTAGLAALGSPRGQELYVNPAINGAGRPAAITGQPIATWIGDWSGNPATATNKVVSAANAAGKLASLVAYNIPMRDCGLYSAGGASTSAAYRTWIDGVADGIGSRQAIVVLEPDALAGLDCLTTAQQTARLADLSYAVDVLTSRTRAFVYVDAGHSGWHTVNTMVSRLQRANIAKARGFALNVSNFYTTAENTAYGNQVSALIGNKPFVIDTSRNGQGSNGEWCNPAGRGLGARPTTTTTGSVDALLWVKYPGESDGECNGGPAAGSWWSTYADGLILNARY